MNKILDFFKSFINFGAYLLLQFGLVFLLKDMILNGNYVVKSGIYIAIEVITMLGLCLLNKDKLIHDFKDFDKNYKKYLKLGFKVWVICFLVMCISNLIINQYILNDIANNEQIDRLVIGIYPLYSVISMILIGPFIEEMAFRLGFKRFIKNKVLYYVLSVGIFAGMHVFNGLTNPLELLYFIPYGSLAFGFSYILDKTDNIFTTTVVHTFHNLLAILFIVLYFSVGA